MIQPTNLHLTKLTLGQRFILLIASSALATLALPGQGLWLLAWLWPIPLAFALTGLPPLKAALAGFFCGWLMWMTACWWLVPALMKFTHTGPVTTLILYASICMSCALPYGIFTGAITRLNWLQKPWAALRTAIAFTVIMYWLPSLIPGNLAHSQYQQPLLIQVVDIGGVPLLLFIMTLFSWLLFRGCLLWQVNRRGAWQQLMAAALLILLTLVYGQLRINSVESAMAEADSMTIASIQPNFVRADNVAPLYQLSQQLLAQHQQIDLLVWPEFPPAFSIIENKQQRAQTASFNKQSNTALMLVSGYVYSDSSKQAYYNASHLMQQGKISANYYKQTLVPFFEYLPFEQAMPWLRQLFPQALHYTPGQQANLFQLKQNINIIPAICYEIIFPDNFRHFVQQGGNIIINPVSDSWFGNSAGSALHFSLALFRSIEYRIPLVRVANSGISAYVQASGKILPASQTQLMTQDSKVFSVALADTSTLYGQFGDWFIYLLSLLFLADIAASIYLKSTTT